ncbi:MAG TPA: hemin uptake protein HemP [Methylotenera sp.]|nr:hemin uptake protein HemP [Methylotenera sp.]
MLNNAPAKIGKSDAKNIGITTSRSITSEALFSGQRELLIEHAGVEYRLRMTNQGKLILTK